MKTDVSLIIAAHKGHHDDQDRLLRAIYRANGWTVSDGTQRRRKGPISGDAVKMMLRRQGAHARARQRVTPDGRKIE